MPATSDSSTPTSSSASELIDRELKSWREAREMPYRLRQAVAVYLENKQFLEGFALLNSTLVVGRSTPSAPRAYIPPPSFFELAATLVVHPRYTTRAKSDEDARAADEALRYLRDTCHVVGPVSANLASAFQFRSARATRRKRKRDAFDDYAAAGGSRSGSDEDEDDDQLKSAFAQEQSVFRQREGFWMLVGWAFNCSVRHKKRWERWKLWLEMMVEVLEADFVARAVEMDEQATRGVEAPPEGGTWLDKVAREAIITQYLEGAGGRGGRRRVVSAILADGGEKAVREFGECWKDETKERKAKEQIGLWETRKINLDENEWGDYAINEDEDDVVQDEKQEITGKVEAQQDFGGIESIKLRQRLLVLHKLADVAYGLRQQFTHIEDLFDVYTELLRPLPLPVFRDFLATATMPVVQQIGLLANLLLPLLAAPPRQAQIFETTQEDLIRWYVPHAANATSIVENARMSLLIEHLLFYMWTDGRLEANAALTAAVERGIHAREAKAIGDARRKDKGKTPDEQAAKGVLDMSAERIRMAIAMLDPGASAGVTKKPGHVYTDGNDVFSSQLSELTQTPSLEEDDGDVTISGS